MFSFGKAPGKVDSQDHPLLCKEKSITRNWELDTSEPQVAAFRRPKSIKIMANMMRWGSLLGAIVFPVVVLLVMNNAFKSSPTQVDPVAIYLRWLAPVIALLMEIPGVFIIYKKVLPRLTAPGWLFDRRQGRFFVPDQRNEIIGDYARLEDIEAVQVSIGKATGQESNFMAYEIDLVLRRPAGQRVPLICHGKEQALRADARALADFLHVELRAHN